MDAETKARKGGIRVAIDLLRFFLTFAALMLTFYSSDAATTSAAVGLLAVRGVLGFFYDERRG